MANKVRRFLSLLAVNLLNLKLLEFNYTEPSFESTYDGTLYYFDMSLKTMKMHMNCQNVFAEYNGEVQIKLNHVIESNIICGSKERADAYLEQFKSEDSEDFVDFEYFPDAEGPPNFHCFKRTRNIAPNFELTIELHLILKYNS